MSYNSSIHDTAQHRLFRSDSRLSPDEVNKLLGVRVRVDLENKISTQAAEQESYVRMFRFAMVTLMLATVAIVGSMYQLKIGPFYESTYALTSSQ